MDNMLTKNVHTLTNCSFNKKKHLHLPFCFFNSKIYFKGLMKKKKKFYSTYEIYSIVV